MTNKQLEQRKELQRQIWQIANEVRGSVDGWDYNHERLVPASVLAHEESK